jgi:hypothetical protein
MITRLVVVAACAGALLAAPSLPAGAAECPVPEAPDADGRVKVRGGGFEGGGTYSPVTVSEFLEPGDTAQFEVRYQNLKTKARGIVVRQVPLDPPGSDPASFRIKYFVGDANVTATVLADGIKFAGVASGASTPSLRIQVKMKNGVPEGDYVSKFLVGNYGHAQCGDIVAYLAGGVQ